MTGWFSVGIHCTQCCLSLSHMVSEILSLKDFWFMILTVKVMRRHPSHDHETHSVVVYYRWSILTKLLLLLIYYTSSVR